MIIPTFKTVAEKLEYLVKNKSEVISAKKSEMKKADGYGVIHLVAPTVAIKEGADKAESNESEEDGVLTVKAIINTTNIMDSHDDVHGKGIWTKTLQENKRIKHLREHKKGFEYTISDGEDLKAYVQEYEWKALGFDREGTTEALVFESKVRKERNEFMYNQYKNGWVDNHSVGMQYVKIEFCCDPAKYEDKEANAAWESHKGEVINLDDAEKQGYFFYVSEAKASEGSAVPDGSNSITPTMSVKSVFGEIKRVNKEDEFTGAANKEAWLKYLKKD